MIGLFIDGAYLTVSWGQVSSQQMDFMKLRAHVEAVLGDAICEAYCFDATTPTSHVSERLPDVD